MKCVLAILGIFVLALLVPADAAQTRTTFGVSVTVTYNCAMDTSKLTAAQRKVVEDYCRKKSEPAQKPAPARQGTK